MQLVALLSLVATLASPAPAAPHPPRPAQASPAPLSPDALYSRRALRRARLLIQMRVMQLRDERLECIRAALERRLPMALWEDAESAPRSAAGVRSDAEKCEGILKI
ncbi:MAG TPA: hypothetical protein VHX17_00840 [Candidatus Cybelea sp.]|nr:hypothetical protein [Candidatus Cybelea sp.]